MRLRYTVEARSHVKAIYDYLAERNPTAALEIVSRIRGAAELLQNLPGFKAYYLVFGGEDTVMAVSLFTSRAAAEASNAKLMPWIRENLGPLFASPTEATEGEVVISEVT